MSWPLTLILFLFCSPIRPLSHIFQITSVVADTGDFKLIAQFTPEDATTNPSLILTAAAQPEYQKLIDDAIEWGKLNYKEFNQAPKSRSSARKGKKKEEESGEEKEGAAEEFSFESLTEELKTQLVHLIVDKICVNFGIEILKIVPGLVSTEVDARLSFDETATIARVTSKHACNAARFNEHFLCDAGQKSDQDVRRRRCEQRENPD